MLRDGRQADGAAIRTDGARDWTASRRVGNARNQRISRLVRTVQFSENAQRAQARVCRPPSWQHFGRPLVSVTTATTAPSVHEMPICRYSVTTDMLSVLKWAAIAGVAGSLTVHVCALVGLTTPIAVVVILALGVFVVCAPAVLLSAWHFAKNPPRSNTTWTIVHRALPSWVAPGGVGVIIYVCINFIVCQFLGLSFARNAWPPALQDRIASGHLLFFYYVAAMLLQYNETVRTSAH